jgi:molybdate transport system substrate-binding protein
MIKYRALQVIILILALVGCNMERGDMQPMTNTNQVVSSKAQSAPSSPQPIYHTLTVFAAASLTGAFEEIGKNYETANPGVTVRFNFAGSQILRTQLEQGASADVFACADHKNMDLLVKDNLVIVNSYQDFVTNKLVIILPAGNPANVITLADIARPHLKLILADTSVPAGNYARQILTKISENPLYSLDFSNKALANVVSNETDVKQVVTKVELGEGDAGIVYVSDAIAASDLVTIAIPDKYNVTAYYPIAVLANAPEPKLGEAFVAYIKSPLGQSVMIKWGFSSVTH